MVNAYVNKCNRRNRYSPGQVSRMFRAKQQIADAIVQLAKTRNPNVSISIGDAGAVFVDIRVNKIDYQFSYRGIDADHMQSLRQCRLLQGIYKGYSMQSIATALYQYSYLLRWQSLQE